MTREEAITVLKAFMKNPLFSEVHKAAFNIAIHDIKAYQDWNINNLILVNKDNYEPTTKNNLGVDCICRTSALDSINWAYNLSDAYQKINDLPSVTPQNQVYPLCEDCHTKMDEVRRAYDNAMKQEPIIDKLRAEITTLQNRCYALTRGTMCAFCRYECKYKIESEDKE